MPATNKSKRRIAKSKDTVIYLHQIESPLGMVRMAANDKGVFRISLPSDSGSFEDSLISERYHDARIEQGGEHNHEAARQLREYFRGKRKKLDFKIDLQATGFKRKTLMQGVRRIPYGQTRSYSDVARAVGSPRAARAVGNANATNPLPFVIPCHRVVAANGIGGYGGGVWMKEKLLELEGAEY